MFVKTKKPVVGCCNAHCRSAYRPAGQNRQVGDRLRTCGVVVENHQPPASLDLIKIGADVQLGWLISEQPVQVKSRQKMRGWRSWIDTGHEDLLR